MKIMVLILAALAILAMLGFYRSIPRNGYLTIGRPGGGAIVFSRTGISLERPPDHYSVNGSDSIEPYIARLLASSASFKHLSMFTPDGARGFGLNARNGGIEVTFIVDWRNEPEREQAIRTFFDSQGIDATDDYLAGNGDVDDATRILSYPVSGRSAELTDLSSRILEHLCDVAPSEALHISYSES